MSTASDYPYQKLIDGWRVSQWALMPLLARLTLFTSVLGNGIDIARATDRAEGVSLSFQVVLRILATGAATVCGVWGWWRLPEVRAGLKSRRGWLAMALVICAFAAAATSPAPKVAFFVAHALGVYMLLTLTCLTLFGIRRTLMDAMFGLWAYVIISWLLRFTIPELATFNEFLSMEETLSRFGGLGHPNVLSAITCLGLLILLVSVRERLVSPLWLVPGVLLFFVTLLETKSRTPVIAFTAAVMVMCAPMLRSRVTYLIPVALVILAFLGGAVTEMTIGLDRAIDSVSMKLTKTGSVDELTSATGRTEIWGQAIALVGRAPLLGYGGGSSSQVMVEHSGHAHNLFLETAVLFGIPAALIFFGLICVNLRDARLNQTFFVREFTTYLLVLGLVESPLFGLVPDPSMCIWLSCLFGPIVGQRLLRG
ncbi:MAG: O-antigen ligase family protein [Pirellulaceae bacterium]|nr:O-antigen ligase family protein [Pirellulaceae bacterium]